MSTTPMTWEESQQFLMRLADFADEFAGIPMPLAGTVCRVHPSYKFAPVFERPTEPPDDRDYINSWYSYRLRCTLVIWRDKESKLHHGLIPEANQAALLLSTFEAWKAWSVQSEINACRTLASLVKPHTYEQYLLLGMFLETSKRSGLTYLFRKLRPTLVLTPHKANEIKILCALCLHPIAYYDGSWAGAMCPTDDVIAHLMMMRGDEAMYWRRANQHHPIHREAGI